MILKLPLNILVKYEKKIVEYTGKEFMDGNKKKYTVNPPDQW